MKYIIIVIAAGVIAWLFYKIRQNGYPDIEDVNYNELRKANYDKMKQIKEKED